MASLGVAFLNTLVNPASLTGNPKAKTLGFGEKMAPGDLVSRLGADETRLERVSGCP